MSKDKSPVAAVAMTAHGSLVAKADALPATSRHYLAVQHLEFAQHCAQQCSILEAQWLGKREFEPNHRAYATAAIMMSVAFLEALVNEVFTDAEDAANGQPNNRVGALDEQTIVMMGQFWKLTERKNRHLEVLEKYQTALQFAGYEPFARGEYPYQNAQKLIQLRNRLVHFKPETRVHGGEAKSDAGYKGCFKDNQLVPTTYPWFPSRALGAGAAEWACQTSRDFASEWVLELGIQQSYHRDSPDYHKP